MAFIGERAFLSGTLDDLWERISELEDEISTATPERKDAIGREYNALKIEYDYYWKRLQECEIPWWKS